MSGRENLVPFGSETVEKQREISRLGGIASGEAKRKKKAFKELLQAALDIQMKNKSGEVLISPDTGEPLTRKEAAMIKLALAASQGDPKSIELAAKMLGEYEERHSVKVDAALDVVHRDQSDAFRWLYNDFSPSYQRFFYENRDSRHVLLQGGRRSGKTQATIRHLARLAAAMNDGVKILVVCYQNPQLLKTIEDFTLATGVVPRAQQAQTPGAVWQFANFDEYTKAQGSQCDYLFINEAVNLPEEIGDVLVLGTRRQVYYNYNPTKASWVQKHINEGGGNLICTTFKDNAYLPPAQVEEFEQMKERALRPNSTMHDRYMYEVYYLGNFATMVGAVFTNLETTSDYQQVPAREYYGLDFGFATDGDPTVLVGCKVHDNKIYIRQYIYQQGLTSDTDLITLFQEAGLNRHCEIYADYGGMGRGRIENLIRLGWCVRNAYKTERVDGLSQMLCYEAVVIDIGSTEARAEFEGLELLPPTAGGHQRTKGADHAVDAARYAFQAAKYGSR